MGPIVKNIIAKYRKLTFLQGAVFATSLLTVAGVAANSIPGFFTFTPNTVISSSEINSNFNKLADLIEAHRSQVYVGAWDASTNTPNIFSTSATNGDYYIVTVGGSSNGITALAGDWIMWNGSGWERIIMPSAHWLSYNGNVYTDIASVGIGTSTPTEKLQVNNGNIRVVSGSVISEVFYNSAVSTAANPTFTDQFQMTGMYFPVTNNVGLSTNGVERLRIDGAGNIGIGKNTTTDKLAILGNMNLDGVLTTTAAINAPSFVNLSDRRLKKNITPIEDSLSKILQLRGVEFDWKKDNSHEIGLIAQEVESVIPDLVVTNKNGLKAVKYSNIVPLLIETTKSMSAEITQLKEENKIMKAYFCEKDPRAPFCAH